MNIKDVLRRMCERDASDLFLKVDNVPYLRVFGELVALSDYPALVLADLEKFVVDLANDVHSKKLKADLDTDFAIDVDNLDRFRVSIFFQRGVPSIVIRRVKKNIPDFKALNLPVDILKSLSAERRGLILLAGPAGHGKSTTIASMMEYMNNSLTRHILTVEDPIEFTFTDKKCIINQRELETDVTSYPVALRQVTLQSPDVIFIGTIRDLPTMSAALSAAEMGILVLSTIHTVNAAQTVERLINFFQPYQHAEMRMQLSFLLKGVISLRLVPCADGSGRVPACEVMTLTPTIARLIREGAIGQIPHYLEDGAMFGMQSFKQSLSHLVAEKKINSEEALKFSDSRDELELELKGIKRLT